jgi:hypothetical protein
MAAVADSGAIYGPAILIPTAILSEIDYLIVAKLGLGAELDLLDDILGGAFTLEPFTAADVRRSRELIDQYSTLNIGLADAAVMATAERLGIRRILTVDERHFRVIRSADGKPFQLLPADA